MPKIFTTLNGYIVTIWSNEKGEPIHVHISKKRPTENSTKFWLCSNGKFILAHNKSRIPENDLRKIKDFLDTNATYIYNFWMSYQGYEKFYK